MFEVATNLAVFLICAGFLAGFVDSIAGGGGLITVPALLLARRKHPGVSNRLDDLCSRYSIDNSHRTKHGALLDAELLAQVYVELTGGRQIGLELAAEQQDSLVATVVTVKRERTFRPARPHTASAEELAAHAEFVASIPSALWGPAQ